jgi:anti-anti-sigma factor
VLLSGLTGGGRAHGRYPRPHPRRIGTVVHRDAGFRAPAVRRGDVVERARITVETRDDWTLVTPSGPLDVATVPHLDGLLVAAQVDAGHRVALVLDQVEFFDAIGLGAVLAAHVRAVRRSGLLALVCAPGRIRNLLAESGLDGLVRVAEHTDGLPRPDTADVSRLGRHDERM